VLKRVELCVISLYVGAFWCVEKGRIMCDFLIIVVPSGVLERVELCVIS